MRYFLLLATIFFLTFGAVSAKTTKKTTQEVRFEAVCQKIVKEVQRGTKKKIPNKLAIDPKNVKSGFQSAYKTALRDITTKQENLRRSKKKVDWVRKGKLTGSGVKELCKIVIVALLAPPPPPPPPPPSPGPGSTGATSGPEKKILFPGKIEKVSAEQLHKNYEDSPHRYRLRVFGDSEFKSVFVDPDINVRFVMPCGYFVNSKLQRVDLVFVNREGKLSDDFGDAVEWRYNVPGECADALITIQIVVIESDAVLAEKSGIEISWF